MSDLPGKVAATTPTQTPLLDVRDLEVRYSGVPAVKGVSFHVDRGETVGLIGPNGAGKSSTVLALAGAVRASSGSATLDGVELTGHSPEEVVRLGLSLVPEGRNMFDGLTVTENLRLGAVARRSEVPLTAAIAEVVELFPILGEFRDRPAGLLSGGQQQQLAIARTLLAAPRMLILDEPSLGLSPTAVDVVFDALGRIRDAGTSVLVVEQRAEFTIAFCDRTHVLHDGRLTLALTPGAAHDADLLTKAYFGS
ncbi:ABC transporter ATP-binding protein [Terrabacter tumescens]|uniref:ABC transporter ATP-binding protein n=1 Tax=Terrabacter tumescens TaxID=60443 RepID=A0ABQ2I6F4_9MICO|nr:ABC transporter ATP-binding protein [Terrabacter tumescens]GGM98516.1 ABC transporter ATP-binding protein [Terrabacter tumescens]